MTIGREWTVVSVERNTSHGKDCSTHKQMCTTIKMFARIARNMKSRMQQRLQKKKSEIKHVNVCSVIDVYVD